MAFNSSRRLKAFCWLALTASLTYFVFRSRVHSTTGKARKEKTPPSTATYHGAEKEILIQPKTLNTSDAPCARHVDTETVHVVIMADENSFIGMLTLANSIVHNTASETMFHFVTFPSDATVLRRWINGSSLKSLKHEIVELSRERLKGKYLVRSPRNDLGSPMNFARILLPDLLPCVGRVIFIDADCLVLGDIRELYDVRIEDKDMVAGANMCDFYHDRKFPTIGLVLNGSHPIVQKASIPKDSCMMNGGMYVADLMKWEKYNISQQLQYWMEINTRERVFKYGDFGSGTQAVLNSVLHDKYTSAPREWNTVSGQHTKVAKPKLVHWNGSTKPWLFPTVPFSSDWLEYHVPDPEHVHVPRNVWEEKKEKKKKKKKEEKEEKEQ